MMKKWICTILAVSMVVTMAAVLNACGNKKEDPAATTVEDEDTTNAAVTDPEDDGWLEMGDEDDLLETYTVNEWTTDEHYEEEYDQLTLPSAVTPTKKASAPQKANNNTAKTTAASTTAAARATTKPFQFASPKDRAAASTTAKSGSTATTAASASGKTSTKAAGNSGGNASAASSGNASGSGSEVVSDTTIMAVIDTNGVATPLDNGNVITTDTPQVSYLRKFVIDRLSGDSYTIQTETVNEGIAVPVTIYKSGDNLAYEMIVSDLMSEELHKEYPLLGKIAGSSKIRFIMRDVSTSPKMYLDLPLGYIDLQEVAKEEGADAALTSEDMKDMFAEMSGGVGEVFSKEFSTLEYVGVTSDNGVVCESYLSPDESTGYNFYFTSEGLRSIEVVNMETGAVEQSVNVKLTEGVPNKNVFKPQGAKMSIDQIRKLFDGLS